MKKLVVICIVLIIALLTIFGVIDFTASEETQVILSH